MSCFKSFFISATGSSSESDELNNFLKSHTVVRLLENCISQTNVQGVQILVEYKDSNEISNAKQKRIDYRSTLKTDYEKQIFDKLKTFRASLAKEKKLAGAYMVCKDEHLAAIVQNPNITQEEIKSLPHANNIMLKDYAEMLFNEYQKILQSTENHKEIKSQGTENNQTSEPNVNQIEKQHNETSEFPF